VQQTRSAQCLPAAHLPFLLSSAQRLPAVHLPFLLSPAQRLPAAHSPMLLSAPLRNMGRILTLQEFPDNISHNSSFLPHSHDCYRILSRFINNTIEQGKKSPENC
jgi:hypothetical protein